MAGFGQEIECGETQGCLRLGPTTTTGLSLVSGLGPVAVYTDQLALCVVNKK